MPMSIFDTQREKTVLTPCANHYNPEQSAHMRGLISVIFHSSIYSIVFSDSVSAGNRPWSENANGQVDLALRYLQMSQRLFSVFDYKFAAY